MVARGRQSGLSLTEMAVVVAVMALLAGLALPAVRMIMESFESGDSAASMISSALASARALAAKEGNYVGVRFQMAYNYGSSDPLNPLKASQYMILIEHDADAAPVGTGLANGFRAVEGHKPVKLPDSIGVMDLTLVSRSLAGSIITFTEDVIDTDAEISSQEQLRDTTTFSIIFSPSGKLVTHEVRVRNRNGRRNTEATQSADDVFNTDVQVTNPTAPFGMFHQDDYPKDGPAGIGPELSRNRFLIYNKAELKSTFEAGAAWSSYLARLALAGETSYINPNTGTIITKD
ncbi:MAG: prepilin-type N-terminal cleavage/methylation domain-containing protein [Sedimentisphaerales bacterium]|nr:prepilin-type N-terminal cleavage/methylation domain-containing protein [Sedimentisphaerales bacterium]